MGEMDMGNVEQERLVDQDHLPEELVVVRENCTPVDTRMSNSGPQCPRQQTPALILILCSLLCSFSPQCNNKSRMLRRHFLPSLLFLKTLFVSYYNIAKLRASCFIKNLTWYILRIQGVASRLGNTHTSHIEKLAVYHSKKFYSKRGPKARSETW